MTTPSPGKKKNLKRVVCSCIDYPFKIDSKCEVHLVAERVVLGEGIAEYWHKDYLTTIGLQNIDIYRENLNLNKIRLIAEILE